MVALESIMNQDNRGRRVRGGEEDAIKMHGVSSIPCPEVSISEVIPATPCRKLHRRRGSSSKPKRGTPNVEKQRAFAKKLQCLMETLKPIPFIPPKILYFSKHENLLKKIGLWDFVHIDFDTSIRLDSIAQLMATYDSKWCCGFVDKIRISVCRTSLARALKLPVKMLKGNVCEAEGLNLGSEKLMEEEIEFIEEILSDWVLLHDDDDEMWLMPNEILPSVLMIKEGHPEEVDWAGLFWFMVENELTRGEGLIDCYYASHLQLLIKSQHEELLTRREVDLEASEVELDVEAKEEENCSNGEDGNDEEVGCITEVSKEEHCLIEGLSMEEKEEMILVGMNDVNEHYLNIGSVEEGRKGSSIDDANEVEAKEEGGGNNEEDENDGEVGRLTEISKEEGLVIEGPGMEMIQPQNVEEQQLVIVNNVNDHYLNSASVEEGRKGSGLDETMERNTTENVLNINVSQDDDDVLEGNGLMSCLVQTMPERQLDFGAPTPRHFQRAHHHLVLPPTPSLTLNPSTGRRNKRLRTNDTFDQMQRSVERCKMMYDEKQKAWLKLNENRALLLNELQRRDRTIEHLKKTNLDDMRTRDKELDRLKRELYIMSNVVDSYKKAVKETQKAFAEFREKIQLHEEPLYKDVGCGGLMLSSGEIEKLCKKEQEEENEKNCLIISQAAEAFAGLVEAFFDKVEMLDKKLTQLEIAVKEMKKKMGQSHMGMKV